MYPGKFNGVLSLATIVDTVSPRLFVRLEPAHHDPVEFVRALDIGEMPAFGHLLVARSRHEGGEAAVLARRRALILGAAENERRHPDPGEAARIYAETP
jgi:hypothetical protein